MRQTDFDEIAFHFPKPSETEIIVVFLCVFGVVPAAGFMCSTNASCKRNEAGEWSVSVIRRIIFSGRLNGGSNIVKQGLWELKRERDKIRMMPSSCERVLFILV